MGVRGVKTASHQGMLPQEEAVSIALFGGTFEPIHIGHLALANYILESDLDIDELWFLPTAQNPLKERESILSFDERCQFIRSAIKEESRFRCCPIERELPSPHYTIHTLSMLQQHYPDYRFSLIIGADNWASIEQWYHWEELLDLVALYVYPRLGYSLEGKTYSNVHFLTNAPIIEISSTEIRTAIKNGKDLRYWLGNPKDFDLIKECFSRKGI